MSIFLYYTMYQSFSAFRAYEVGVTKKGLPENLFSKASPFIVTTALLSESRNAPTYSAKREQRRRG